MTALLAVTGLTRRFAGLVAVDGVDLAVAEGTVHAIIGPNGAGKTTLFNLISGIDAPNAGQIMLGGQDVTRHPAHRRAALGVARTFQNIRIFGAMTVLENVLTGLHPSLHATLPEVLLRTGRFRREEAGAAAQARAALTLTGLSDQAALPAASLPYGGQRRLEIARAMAGQPRLLLLDEPAAGLNPAETTELAALVRRIRAAGTTVLLVEHDMGFVMDISDRVTVLSFGRRIFEGAPAEVRQSPVVIEAYLGQKVAARLAQGLRAGGARRVTGLVIEGLTVAYGRTVALHGIGLAVPEGRCVCLIGANGAGKTSMMRALSGLVRPRAGRVVLDGQDIAGWRPHRIAALGLRQVPEGRQVFGDLTVQENLALGAYLVRDPAEIARRRDAVLARFPRLAERLGQRAGSMSGGEQQMLAFGRALMGAPRLLLLDEPSMGLAPLFVEEVFAAIAALRAEGVTLLLVEQNASAALDVADYAYVIENGRIGLHGPAAEIAENPAVIAAYLGG